MNTCPHCGAGQVEVQYPLCFDCGTIEPHHRTGACKAREPLFRELQTAKFRMARLDELGQRLNVLLCCEAGFADTEEWSNAMREDQLRMIETASQDWDVATGRLKP